MTAPALDTRGVRKAYGGLPALRGIDFRLESGEAVALFGPNGAGKSTLLRLGAALLRPTEGTVRVFGTDPRADPRIRRRIGFLSHQSFLYPDLTPLENLTFYARLFGLSDPPQRAHALLADVGLTGWVNRPLRTLSRGMEQRCALARALLHEPDLLLLDEPFTGLDVDATATLQAALGAAHARGAALLMTTHDLAQGLTACRRALILVRGALVWDGPVAAGEGAAFQHTYLAAIHGAAPPEPRQVFAS